ncbi:hypothetical protein BD410DRAFT_901490 [Rickenella mellea]|uniref:Uncharacterized protein n=1 Tax=Rickenella mellea TaxID=50990 RepID=A0A4Y7PPN3_9AGAM|nr:hypothetical protein BD410DRAFT_901490 [Rickenella mellea]
MPIQVDVACLAGYILGCILYGIYLSLFVVTMHILLGKKQHQPRPNIPMIVAAVLMFLFGTVQIVLHTRDIFQAFINMGRTHRLQFLTDATKPLWAVKAVIYFATMIIGDAIVIYRTFIVWGRNFWVILVPVCCTLGSAASACGALWAVRHISSVTVKEESMWGYAIFSLSLAANSVATVLLAYKIWAHEARVHAVLSAGSRMARFSNMIVVKIVLETGAINAAYLISYIVIFRCGSYALYVLEFMSNPVLGIIFVTVILRTSTAAQHNSMSSTRGGPSEISRMQFAPSAMTARSHDIESSTSTETASMVMDECKGTV